MGLLLKPLLSLAPPTSLSGGVGGRGVAEVDRAKLGNGIGGADPAAGVEGAVVGVGAETAGVEGAESGASENHSAGSSSGSMFSAVELNSPGISSGSMSLPSLSSSEPDIRCWRSGPRAQTTLVLKRFFFPASAEHAGSARVPSSSVATAHASPRQNA